ncbi:Cell division control protein [Phytophthora palmivora]|uniref:Cell division control protein n=1 Tax=Phytophthora palmivora TaxID=4796 RepID=A0A2P4YDZ4_9STRA|nr:Cell division control protein [Phytophthora palmivora]
MDSDGCTALHWVKLRSMQVFWPACVYKSYSAAVAHTHDVWPLRNDKPALDAEDRVLYFFGVGPRACHVVASGSAPNLQLCVAHEDDVTLEDWTAAEDFVELCNKHQIPEDLVTRAQNNACFRRACDEAATYVKDVQTDEQAGELFVTLLTMAKKAQKIGKAVVVREIIPSPLKTPVKKTKTKKEVMGTPDVAKVLKTPTMAAMVTKCWQQMLEMGWETMTQGDGQVLYKMPGTSFFDFVPNVNLFDSLEKACARYLSDWVKSTAVDSTDEFSELTEFLWPMAVGSGWESMTTNTETLYKKANTPFDQWVPNVTIFRSKTQAVAKYLEECGLIGDNNDNTSKKNESKDAGSDAADSDVEMEEPQRSESECEELSQVASDESADEESDGEDNQEEDAPVASVKKTARKNAVNKTNKAAPKSQPPKTVAKPPAKQIQPVKKVQKKKTKSSKPKQAIPPFKMAFGKLENELKNRGWYWKNGGLQWFYYQPYCKTKDKKSLKPNVDFFRGREELEAHLDSSGEYAHIRAKLEEDHIRHFAVESESECEEEVASSDEEELNYSLSVKTPFRAAKLASKPQPTKVLSRNARRRSKSTDRFRRTRSKSTTRARGGLSSQTTLAEVKFGEIWRVLSEDGWHYRYGAIECDYFKPHCATAKDGKPGVDYFQTKDQLIEYLQTSGIWDRTAARVRAEAAMDSSDEDMSDSDNETATPAQKRKREEMTPAPQHAAKKQKDEFRTPTYKSLATGDLSDDDDDMGETISPDPAGVKGKENHSNGRQPLRNLANSFTPSPNAARKDKGLQLSSSNDIVMETAKEVTPGNMMQNAIQKLTSAYIPTNFRHREKEFSEIRKFFSDCFEGKDKTSLYISGAPGCGKTALLKSTQSEIDELYRECCPEEAKEPVRCHVNAMALADSSTLFCKLAEALTKKAFSNGNEAFETIERVTTRKLKSSKTMILILDEIDTLLKNNGIESDLCRLFELAHRASNSFILVGIANQVDFTERHLPMLQQRLPDCSPRVVIFEPYKHQTIEQILVDRLGGQTEAPKIISLHGIAFLARKVASTTGDIRLAVDICRRVLQHTLDLADKEKSENPSNDNEFGRPLPLTDALRIIKHALESKSAMVIRSLPRNLQMILFASTRLLIVAANRAAADGSEITPLFGVDELYSCYCEVSKDAGIFKPLPERDFRTALDTLGKEGLIAEAELRKHLIKLLFSTSELLQSFRKDAFFSRLV